MSNAPTQSDPNANHREILAELLKKDHRINQAARLMTLGHMDKDQQMLHRGWAERDKLHLAVQRGALCSSQPSQTPEPETEDEAESEPEMSDVDALGLENMNANLGDTIHNGIPPQELAKILQAQQIAAQANATSTSKPGILQQALPLLLATALGAGGMGLATYLNRPASLPNNTNLTAPAATLKINQQPPAFRLEGSQLIEPSTAPRITAPRTEAPDSIEQDLPALEAQSVFEET